MSLIAKIFGTRSQREIKKIQPTVDAILSLEEEYKALSEDALKAKTNDATKLAILNSYDQVLSLSLLEKAAAVREANAKAQTAKAEGGYTVTGEGDPAIDALVMQRYEAKKSKNFAEADRIRDELKAQGIEIVDTKDGASWKRV